MTTKEKKLKNILELVTVQARIEELKNCKPYLSSSFEYSIRINTLKRRAAELEEELGLSDDTKEYKIVVELPEGKLKDRDSLRDEVLQYFKRTYEL